MKQIFFYSFLAITLFACNKDKFKTEPQVEIKFLNPSEVRKGELITFTSIIRDKEADVDSVTLVRKIFNGTSLLTVDTLHKASMNEFSVITNNEFEFTVILTYGEFIPDVTKFFQNLETVDNRFLSLGIIVKDKAGNTSEYVESEKILLKRL